MYRAAIANQGDSKFYATTRDASFVMTVNGEGANPVETFLAGLCGCVGHYVHEFIREKQLPCPAFTVEARANQTEDKSRLSKIDIQLDLKSTRLENQDQIALLKFVEKCKLHNTLKPTCHICLALA